MDATPDQPDPLFDDAADSPAPSPLSSAPSSASDATAASNLPNVDDMPAFLEKVRVQFESRMKSIRQAFQKLDPRSYGYVPDAAFRSILDSIGVDLTPEEKDAVVQYVDSFGSQDGKVCYAEFYGAFFGANIPSAPGDKSNSLRHIIVITRHGARFPLKPFPNSNAWPRNEAFWTKYGGKLTPVGQKQHLKLGERLGVRYVHCPGTAPFLRPDDPTFASRLRVFCSNTDRTLYSAESLLLGMFPHVSHAYNVEKEASAIAQVLDGIEITLAEDAHTALLHGFKENPVYDDLKSKAMKSCPQWQAWGSNQAYVDLLARCFDMTGYSKIDPKQTPDKTFPHFQSLAQQIAIERAHKMKVFSNAKGDSLNESDEAMIREVADFVCRLRYCGNNDEEQKQIARLATGLLPAFVVNTFRDVIAGKTQLQMTLLSAHDNTLMALLSHLGFRNWPIPQFAANVIFELHQHRDGAYTVRVAYDYDPGSLPKGQDPPYVKVPIGGGVVDWAAAESGRAGCKHAFAEFEQELMQTRVSLPDEAAWRSEGHKGFENAPKKEKKKDGEADEDDE